MSEPRKNHLSIDGGQVKEDDHVASYKPIPESDTDFKSSKSSLSKAKEKASPDGAEEKLLSKEDEAKVVRVDMADAKYVVGDHRNGDAKIELDANKRQFSGMTKEELMKYADDPFWVNLRWCMFVLFWAMWLAMLAGAITIIVRAPRCDPPKEWFEKYPMVDSDGMSLDELKPQLLHMSTDAVHGVFVDVPTYDNDGDFLTRFENFVNEAKKVGVKVIVNLTPNFVHKTHPWFVQSENRSVPYDDYFLWAAVKNHNSTGDPAPPNNWVSTLNTSAWSYSATRKEFYLHQYGENQPDLNFWNKNVVREFSDILAKWMQAGADGVRLYHARHLLVNSSFPDEDMNSGHGSNPAADHTSYDFWRHKETTDFPGLEDLLNKFAAVVNDNGDTNERKVFTVKEEGTLPELFRLAGNVSYLRPPAAAAVPVANASAAANTLRKVLEKHWPLVQLKGDAESGPGLALFSMVLPATPVLDMQMLQLNATAELKSVREDASVQHGHHAILAVPAAGHTEPTLLACARWKDKGVVAVYNPGASSAAANLSSVPQLPRHLAVRAVSRLSTSTANLTMPATELADQVMVPAKSTVLLSYEPLAAAAS